VRRSPDVASVVAGACVIALGVMLLLDAAGTIDLRFRVLGPALLGAMGAILLASGLTRPR
jgi:hypothetical protein